MRFVLSVTSDLDEEAVADEHIDDQSSAEWVEVAADPSAEVIQVDEEGIRRSDRIEDLEAY